MNAPDRDDATAQFRVHGGRLAHARACFPNAPEPWIDLSTGICPWPYPIPPLPVECWSRLPDPADLEALLSAARRAYRIPPPATIAAVAGSDLAISLLPRLIARPTQVTILAPTYACHEKAWRAGGHDVRLAADLSEIGTHGIGVAVNPNNPDGRRWDPAHLVDASRQLAGGQGFLLVDEAFCDVTPELSLLQDTADLSRLVVLRSFGKFFGLAGLRLGFVATAHPIGRELVAAISDWPVSGPAIAIGRTALADDGWIAQTQVRLTSTAARLDRMLTAAGFDIIGGTSLFRLGRHAQAQLIFQRLARHGILVRPFSGNSLLRFGLPASDEQFARLSAALRL